MCRIAGIVSPCFPIEELEYTVGAMCYVQRHGGPDDQGFYTNREHSLVLGHRRLSLLDLQPSGHQPMHYARGRYTISFNGEIYNYRQLRDELRGLGHSFQSTGDTEVILAAFAAWGTAAFARLNGMFAFALFDNRRGELYLVRDPLGIKPLYYLRQEKTLAFASEVRAFAQWMEPLEEDPHWPVFLMAYGHLPEPVTTLKRVCPLPKGSFLRFETSTGRCSTEVFEHLSFFEKEQERPAVIGAVRSTLQGSVQRHLLSDAPIGVFLSGGIDSSVITSLAAEEAGQNLNTLSLYFSEAQFSEKTYQEIMARRLSSTNYQHLLTEEEFHRNLPECIDSMDLPSSDGINTWFISRMAKEAGLKAVLSGIGGDELFGGYPSFGRARAAAALQGLPAAALKISRYTYKRKLRRLAYLSLPGAKGQYLFLRGFFSPHFIARFLGLGEEEVWKILEEQPLLPDIRHLSPGNRASWLELNLYMQNQLLRDADVMSMAHGIELRVPFLDKDLVRLVLSVSSRTKYTGRQGKQLLIDSFRPELPEQIWQRKKMGFSFPFAKWLKEDEWVLSRVASGGRISASLLKRFEQGSLHWSWLLTALLLQTHSREAEPAFLNA